MSRYLALMALTGLLAGSFAFLWSDEPAKEKDKAKEKDAKSADVDILKDALAWNSGKFVAPPTKFRQGHVNAKTLDEKAIVKSEKGFTVSLPSNAPIPTPTIYQGNIYASGGFHSKEFYCLKADSGAFVWGMSLDDDGPSAAVVSDDVVVFNTESCTIFALDAKTGKQLWSYWLGDPLTSTPTIANGKVFTSYPAAGGGGQQDLQNENNAPNGGLQKLDKVEPPEKPAKEKAPNGGPQKLDKVNPPEKPAPKEKAPPAKPNEKDMAKAAPPCSHVLVAFELKTGKIVWQRWIDSDVMSAPVAVDKELYVSSFAGVVYKFNQEDGKILSAVKSRATSAPVVVGKNVYLTQRADDGKGPAKEAIALQDRDSQRQIYQAGVKKADYIDAKVQEQAKLAQQGKKLDEGNGFGGGAPQAANPQAAASNVGQGNVSTMQAFQGSRILNLAGRNYNCMGDEVVCTDPATGKNLWTHKLKGDLKAEGGALAAPPAAAGGMLFLVTLQGEILQMDPKEGKVVKTYKIGHEVRFQPVVEAGKIYVGTQNGKIVCIDTGDQKFTGWSCWGGNAAHTGFAAEGK